MNYTNIPEGWLKDLLIQAPVLLAGCAGVIVVLRFWRKAPQASVWALGGFALVLVRCVLILTRSLMESVFTNEIIVPVLGAVAYLLLLVGVYVGRTYPATGNVQEAIWQPVVATLRARPGLKRIFLVVFTTVFVLVVCYSALWAFIMPEAFRSTARVRLYSGELQTKSDVLDPRLVQTEFEVAKSAVILDQVVDQLDLNEVWRKKYNAERRFKTADSRLALQRMIELRPVRDTSLMDITAYSDNPGEASAIANRIAEVYQAYHKDPRSAGSTANAVRVEILERAEPSARPFRPDVPVEMLLGVWEGAWLAAVLGALAVWAGFKIGKKPPAIPNPAALTSA